MRNLPLKVGIVGAGLRGNMFANILRQREGANVAGMADSNERAAAVFVDAFNVPTYSTADELYCAQDLDAVIIATPDFAHESPTIAACQRGIPVLVEKPLTTSMSSANAIVSAAQATGTPVVTGFENRWNPAILQAKKALAEGQIGHVLSQSAYLASTTRIPLSTLSWAAHTSPTWFFMSHTVDLALLFAQQPVATVYAKGYKQILIEHGIDTYDSVHAILAFTNGTTAMLDSTWILPDNTPAPFPFRYEIRGSNGSIAIDQTNQGIAITGTSGHAWPRTIFSTAKGRFYGFPAWMTDEFLDVIQHNAVPEVSLESALAVTEVQCAIEQSLKTGQEITLPLTQLS